MTMAQTRRPQEKSIAIIGAGAAGLCTAKYFLEAGFKDVTVMEAGSQLGGMWCYENDNGLSSAYKTLHINTSRSVTCFHDLEFAPDVQTFPDHWDMHRYLIRYAEHFGVADKVRFNARVTNVSPVPDPTDGRRWAIEFQTGSTEFFDTVVVATGHLSVPNHVPLFRDSFTGQYLHSHYYREPAPFVGKRVCIVGVGNSALDISGDICATAERCVLVARSGALIMPKYLFGIPGTDLTMLIQRPWLPGRLRRWLLRFVAWLAHGDQTKLGFRPMTERTHATSNGTIINDVLYQRVEIKHEIESIEGNLIRFSDGSEGEFDTIIAATGYMIDLRHISDKVVQVVKNRLKLYKRMVAPGWSGLYFVGFFNTDTALNMVFERQANWIRQIEMGTATLPSVESMEADIEAKDAWVAKYYKHTDRHTIEEEHVPYLRELARSLKQMKASS